MNKVLVEYYEVKKDHDKKLGTLQNKVTKIINVIVRTFKIKDHWWWEFAFCVDGDDAPLPQNIENNIFPIYISVELKTNKLEYNRGFPIEFFDMTDEQIEEYIKKEIEENNKKKIIQLEIARLRRENKNKQKLKEKQLIDRIKKKLTLQEIEILKI